MEIADLIVRIVEALAWPVVACVLVLVLKKEILERLPFLAKLRIGGLEAEFKQTLDAQPQHENGVTDSELDRMIPQILSIARISPIASIPHAWSQLERKILEKLSSLQGFEDTAMGYRMSKQVEILREQDFLSPEDAESIQELRSLRNKVSHHHQEADSITFETAREYASKCAHYINVIDAIPRKSKATPNRVRGEISLSPELPGMKISTELPLKTTVGGGAVLPLPVSCEVE